MIPAIVINGSSPWVCDASLQASPGHWNQCAPRQLRFRGNPYGPDLHTIINDMLIKSLPHNTQYGCNKMACRSCRCGPTRNPDTSNTETGSSSAETNQHTLRTGDNDVARKPEASTEKQIKSATDAKEENSRDSTGDVTLDALLEHVFGNMCRQSFAADPEGLVEVSMRGSECCGSENSVKCMTSDGCFRTQGGSGDSVKCTTSDGCPRTQAECCKDACSRGEKRPQTTDKSSLPKATEKDSDQEHSTEPSIEPSDTTSSRSDTAAEPSKPEISSQDYTDHTDVSLEVSNAVLRDHDQEYERPQHSSDAKCAPNNTGRCLDTENLCPEGNCPSKESQPEAGIDAGELKATKEERQFQGRSDNSPPFRVTFDLSQFAPEEIQVKLSDRKLIIDAKHESVDNGLVIQDVMHKAVTLPPTVDPDSLRCLLADKGHLTITGDRFMLRNQDKVLTIEM